MESTTDQVRIQRAEDGEKVIELYCRKHWWRLNSKISPKMQPLNMQRDMRYECMGYILYMELRMGKVFVTYQKNVMIQMLWLSGSQM